MKFVPDEGEAKFVPDGANANPNAGLAGILSFGAGLAGLPVDLTTGVLNAAPMAFGTAATALGRPDLAPQPITKPFLGGESIRGMLRGTGIPLLNPNKPAEGTAGLAYDFAASGGGIPGMNIPAIGAVVAEKTLGPEWRGVGALAPGAVAGTINAATAPGRAQRQAQNVVRDGSLQRAQDAGYVTPPSLVNPGVVENTVESLAGKAALNQSAQLRNQQVTNSLVREELQVPANTPLTENLLAALRNHHAQPYRDVANVSPIAAQALERLRDVRSEATAQWRHWNMQGVPEARRQAMALDTQAAALERVIERQAVRSGHPNLVQELRDARTYIAKTYDIERSLNFTSGNVDARALGRLFDRRGENSMTGNLETIARFSHGPGAQFTREASGVPTPGVSALNWPTAAMLGTVGGSQLGASGVALGALPFVRGGVREGVLTRPYQDRFARPDYAGIQTQGGLERLLQQLELANR